MVKFLLEKNSTKTKYLQLVDSITKQIEKGNLVLNQKLPSVNELSKHFGFSRATVFMALNYLNERGIVIAVDKVGYFINDITIEKDFKVFFMLDKFTPFKEDLYNSLISCLGVTAKINLFFHHQNFELFSSLITQNLKNYTHFVITTYLDKNENVAEVLNLIPPEKLIILDKYEPNLANGYGMIYQDFDNDLFNALSENSNLVKKYTKLILINHENSPHGDFVKKGFTRFCQNFNISGIIDNDFDKSHFQKGNLYITIDAYDRDLVEIIKLTQANNWKLGNQIGLISYNDTPTKEILDGGITVISTDFKEMGAEAANMILSGDFVQKPNRTKMILRNSL